MNMYFKIPSCISLTGGGVTLVSLLAHYVSSSAKPERLALPKQVQNKNLTPGLELQNTAIISVLFLTHVLLSTIASTSK